jgi:hypothetical protein
MNSQRKLISIFQFRHPPNVMIVMERIGIINPLFQCSVVIAIPLDILFAPTGFLDELCQLLLQLLDRFLLSATHGVR